VRHLLDGLLALNAFRGAPADPPETDHRRPCQDEFEADNAVCGSARQPGLR